MGTDLGRDTPGLLYCPNNSAPISDRRSATIGRRTDEHSLRRARTLHWPSVFAPTTEPQEDRCGSLVGPFGPHCPECSAFGTDGGSVLRSSRHGSRILQSAFQPTRNQTPHKLLRRVTCRGGGTGRRTGLKILRSARVVRVRFPPPAITYDELHDAGKRRGRELSGAYLPARQTHALHSGRERAPVSRNGAVGVVLPGLLMHQLTDAARRAVWLQTQTSPRPAGSCRGRRSSGSSPTRRSEDGKTRRV